MMEIPMDCKPCPQGGYCPGQQACECHSNTLRAEVERLRGERDAVKARKEEACRVLVASSLRNKAANVRIEKLYDMLRAVIVALGGVAEPGASDECLKHAPEEAAAMKARAEAAEAEVIRMRGELAGKVPYAATVQPYEAELAKLRGELAAAKAMHSTLSGTTNGAMQVAQNWKARAEEANVRIEKLYDMLRAVIVALGGVAEPGVSLEFLEGVPDEAAAVVKRLRETEAHAAELLEVLETIDKELTTISYGKQEEIRNDVTAGESHGWCAAHDHIGPIIVDALSRTPAQSLADIQARALREAAERISTMPERMGNAFGGITREDVRREVLMMAQRREKDATDAQAKD